MCTAELSSNSCESSGSNRTNSSCAVDRLDNDEASRSLSAENLPGRFFSFLASSVQSCISGVLFLRHAQIAFLGPFPQELPQTEVLWEVLLLLRLEEEVEEGLCDVVPSASVLFAMFTFVYSLPP